MFLLALLPILTLYLGSALSNPVSSANVTIWQFGGVHRLAAGTSTEPLQAIGTATDGLATTYLYQVLNPQVQTIATGTTNQLLTGTATVTRTIVISASGWIESFDNPTAPNAIQCSFVSGQDGVCFDRVSTASGAAASVVLAVSMSSPPAMTTSFPTSTQHPGSYNTVLTTATVLPSTSTSALSNASGRPLIGIFRKMGGVFLLLQVLVILIL
ncbi:hypothetical protein D9757_014452 [Collybiopsis confluens]|uniref:Uncharacterized protein n=1 Tax=Collybiopsis confluens TaxID=2823264 RepID=A0A8H5FUJ5_9AGAR|nr:hypothetical protein D9757_013652 [Collybiopsis confluens]KAF5350290.1 hypothetical protein D9757_014452 [Collybiopsis confluens]